MSPAGAPRAPHRAASRRRALACALALAAGACGNATSSSTDASIDASTSDVAAQDASPDAADAAAPRACEGLPADTAGVTLSGEGRFRRLEGVPLPEDLHARTVTIYLPAGYDDTPERRYPVLYMHDGRNLFDRTTATYGIEWGVDEVVDQLVGLGEIDELIVVGVDHSDERIPDYTPSADPEYGGGKGPRYVAWLAGTLKPVVDTLLRTECARDATGLAGSSLGGLISFWAGLHYGDVFGRIGAVSPSFWWDGAALLGEFDAYTGPLPSRLWIDMGTAEDDYDPQRDGVVPPSVADVRRARDRALARGATFGGDLGYLEAYGWAHNESAWRQRLPAILRFLYGELPLAAPDSLTLRVFTDPLDLTAGPAETMALLESRHGAKGRLTWPNRLATFATPPPAAITVDADGRVRAAGAGTSPLTATLGALTAEVALTVTETP